MILNGISSKGVQVAKTFDESDYSSPSEFENAILLFINEWSKNDDPLVRTWKDYEISKI